MGPGYSQLALVPSAKSLEHSLLFTGHGAGDLFWLGRPAVCACLVRAGIPHSAAGQKDCWLQWRWVWWPEPEGLRIQERGVLLVCLALIPFCFQTDANDTDFQGQMEDCNCSNTYSRCLVPTPISSKPGIEMPILHLGLILAIETEGFRQVKYHPRNELLKTYTWPSVWHPDWGERERKSLALFAGPQWMPPSHSWRHHTLATDTVTTALRELSEMPVWHHLYYLGRNHLANSIVTQTTTEKLSKYAL